MASFSEANQARLALKMNLSNYAWYNGSSVVTSNDDYVVVIHVARIDNDIKKVVPPFYHGATVKTEIENFGKNKNGI